MRISFCVSGIPPKTTTGLSPYRTDANRMMCLRTEAAKHFEQAIARGTPIHLRARIHADKGAGDLDNYLKAICDALQGDQGGSTVGRPEWASIVPDPTKPVAFEDDADVTRIEAERFGVDPQSGERFLLEICW